MRVIGLQMDIGWEDAAANRAKVEGMMAAARLRGGELVVLPEMFGSGFTMNVGKAVDPDAGAFLGEAAKRFGVTIVAGIVSRGAKGLGRNEAMVIDPSGKEVARYCKMHPFSMGKEDQFYEAGDGVATFAWGEFKVAPFVCYDLRFPEIFRAAAVKHGAELLVVIANWPSTREEHWVTLLKARAIENQAYVVGVNRCGRDPQHVYPGRSLIVDPHGKVMADAGDREGIVEAEIDAGEVKRWREEFPVLRDVRGNTF